MRKPLLSLGLAALLAGACSSSATPSGGRYVAPPPEHHEPTPPAAEPATADPLRRRHVPGPRGQPLRGSRTRTTQSTFGLDVDTASYTVARRYISDGNLPDPASVRVEEFVNYFDQGYAAPEGDAFAIHVDGGPSPFLAEDEVLLRIGIKAREVAERSRPDASLTFVIDVSGSMARENRLELVKQSLAPPRRRAAARRHRRDRRLRIRGARRPAARRPRRQPATILDAIDSLQPEGSTNAEAGLRLGYEMAREQLREEGINRVVLAVGRRRQRRRRPTPRRSSREIRHDAETGIQLVTVGFGMGNFNDVLLEQLADDGDGFYAYVDDLDEARRVFVDDLTGTLQSVALDARVQVEFNADAVEAYRLIGFENRAINDKDFRDDNVDARRDRCRPFRDRALRRCAWRTRRAGERPHRDDQPALVGSGSRNRPRGARSRRPARGPLRIVPVGQLPTFKLDAIVAATAERFRGSPWGETYDLADVDRDRPRRLRGPAADPGGPRLPRAPAAGRRPRTLTFPRRRPAAVEERRRPATSFAAAS